MPGIAGWVSHGGKQSQDLLARMLGAMTHSKDQVVQEWQTESIALGRADHPVLNPGRQPLAYGDLSVLLQGGVKAPAGSGEPSDGPSLVGRLYALHGESFPEHMEGSYAAAVWDLAEERLVLAGDRFGRCPLYYAHSKDGLLFASEIKALLCDEHLSKELDAGALADFLQYGYMLEDETHFRGISLLPYAGVLRYDARGIDLRRYWEYTYDESASEKPSAPDLNRHLDGAMRAAARVKGRLGVLLSGGLDSRNMAGRIPKERDFTCITFGREGCLDQRVARSVCRILGKQHVFVELAPDFIERYSRLCTRLMEGMSYSLTSQACALLGLLDDYDCILDGTSADMIFGSFLDEKVMSSRDLGALRDYLRRRHSVFSKEELKELLAPSFLEKAEPEMDRSFDAAFERSARLHREFPNIADHYNFTQRQRRFMINGQVVLRSHAEVINPFFDYALIDLMLRVPPEERVGEHLYIKACIDGLGSLAGEIWQKTGLPPAAPKWLVSLLAVYRKGFTGIKRGLEVLTAGRVSLNQGWHMMDYSEAVRRSEAFIRQVLLSETARARGIFNHSCVEAIIDGHMKGRRRDASKIAVLLGLELWFQEIYDPLWEAGAPPRDGRQETPFRAS